MFGAYCRASASNQAPTQPHSRSSRLALRSSTLRRLPQVCSDLSRATQRNLWVRHGTGPAPLPTGASVLVIRLTPVTWAGGPVTFTISPTEDGPPNPGTPDYLGSLSGVFPSLPAPDSGGGLGTTSVTVGATSPKIVFYRPPNNFLFWSSDSSDGPGTPLSRVPLTITATGTPGGPVTATIKSCAYAAHP